ncbi:MAG: hypothetical protein WEA09_03605, partial [Gemmatimonadota bacterium]
ARVLQVAWGARVATPGLVTVASIPTACSSRMAGGLDGRVRTAAGEEEAAAARAPWASTVVAAVAVAPAAAPVGARTEEGVVVPPWACSSTRWQTSR